MATLLAPYHLAGLDADPPCAVLAPDRDDELPDGVSFGELALADAPQGCRTVVGGIEANWVWRLTDGEGVAVRQGKGAPRGSGVRPKLRILEPCRSVALRCVGVDQGFPDVSHHVVAVWVFIERTGKWKIDRGWLASSEPSACQTEGGPTGRGWAHPPAEVGLAACRAVLAGPPDAAVVDAVYAEHDAEIRAEVERRPVIGGRS